MSSCPESDIFTDAASVTECLEVLESFAGTVVKPGFSPWVYVDKHTISQVLVVSYREIRAAAVTDGEGFDVSAPDAMSFQSSVPAQSSTIDVSKV